jgi:hypothetical protein
MRRKEKQVVGMVGAGVVHAGASASRNSGIFQLGPLRREAGFREAQKDEAEHRLGVLPSLQAGVGAELVSGIPEALLKGVGACIVF